VDIDLVEFFRTIMFKTTTTGSTSRAAKSSYGRSTVQSTSNWRSVSTIREFAMIRPPSPVHKKEEAAGENRAMNRYIIHISMFNNERTTVILYMSMFCIYGFVCPILKLSVKYKI